jgi:hypothetical protein
MLWRIATLTFDKEEKIKAHTQIGLLQEML